MIGSTRGATRGTSRHVPALDGIRGLAIALVLVWHYCTVTTIPGSPLAYAMAPLRLTYTGVDLFFVLSGFLIGGILVDTRGRDGYFSSFYARRALRILPVYVVVIAGFYLLVALRQHGAGGLGLVTAHPLPFAAYATFTQNLAMIKHGAIINGVSVTWSLAVEEQVYLFLPLIIMLCPPRRLPLAGAAMVVVGLGSRFLWSPGTSYLATVSRLDAIGLGMLVALLVRSRVQWSWLVSHGRVAWACLAAGSVGYVLVLLRVVPEAPLGLTLVAIFYTALLLVVLVDPEGWIARGCEMRWLRALGTISYTTYLLHMPVLMVSNGILLGRDERFPTINDAAGVVVMLLSLVLTLLFAAASWRWYESPILRLKRYVPSPVSGQPRVADSDAVSFGARQWRERQRS